MNGRTSMMPRPLGGLLRALAVGGVALVLGCTASEAGIDPPVDELFFPTGLAVDPGGDILYVTNGNSDLRYNGGTLMALDLGRLQGDIESFRQTGEPPAALDGDEATACRRDAIVPGVLECQTSRYAYADQTIKLGNFAGQIGVAAVGSESASRLFIPVRGEPSLTWVSASLAGGGLELNCGNDGPLERCGSGNRLMDLLTVDPPEVLPGEPFGVFVDDLVGTLYLTSFVTGQVSLFDIHVVSGDAPEYVDVHADLFTPDLSGRIGGVGVATRPCRWQSAGPVELLQPEGPCAESELTEGTFIYVTSHYSAEVAVLSVRGISGRCDLADGDCSSGSTSTATQRDLRLVLVERVLINALDPSSDLRGIAFSEDGTRAYVVDRSPPGLVVIDTSLEDGLPRNEIVDAVAVCAEPSHVYLRRVEEATRAYVVCFAAGVAQVVDTDTMSLVDSISLGQGPNAMAFTTPAHGVPLGFAANFTENAIGVIDLQPGSPTENQVIARIGYRSPLEVH